MGRVTGYREGDSLRKGRPPGQRVKMRAFVRQEILQGCRDLSLGGGSVY